MRKKIIFRTSRMRIHLLQQAEQPRTVSKHGGGWIAAAVAAITGKGVYDNRRRKPAKSDDSEDNSDEK